MVVSGLSPEDEEFAEADAILAAQAAEGGHDAVVEVESSEVDPTERREWVDGVMYRSRIVSIPGAGPQNDTLSLTIREVPHTSACYGSTGGIVWPAATVLAEILPTIQELRQPNAVILEIGAGCGIPGLTAAALCTSSGSRVFLTDETEGVLDNLNFIRCENAAKLKATVEVSRLVWEDVLDKGEAPVVENVDVLIGSDVIWSNDRGEMVQRIAKRLLRPGGLCVIANTACRDGLDVFEGLMKGEHTMKTYTKSFDSDDRLEEIKIYECRSFCVTGGLSMAGYSGPAVPVAGASSAMDPAIREVYEKNGQGQVLRFVDEGKLDNEKVGTLGAQMKTIDVEKACAIFKTTMEEAAKGAVPEDLGPPDPSAVMMGTTASQASKDEWESISFGAIAKGEIAACVLAGGQGTRLGLDGPKGNYSIGLLSGKSLFQLFAERLLRLQNLACKKAGVDKVSLPFLVMTSPINHEQTVSAFKENKFWGLTEEDVIFFPQGVLPCFTPEGKFIMEVGHVIATSPDGNGGIYPALESSGSLKFLRDHGVKYLHVFGVDNAVVRPADPRFMGYCIAQGSDCGNKSVWKSHPEEKVGVMAQRGGRYCVAEYSELDAERKNVTDSEGKLKFGAGNICNHFFSVDFLSNVVVPKLQGMYHVANKKIPFAADDGVSTQKPDKNNGIKLEAFIFDVFPMAEGSKMAIYEVEREEFSPVKNPPGDKEDSPDTARAIVNSLHRKWVEAAGGKIEGPAEALVEVLPLCSYAGEGLEEIAAGKTFTAPCVIGG